MLIKMLLLICSQALVICPLLAGGEQRPDVFVLLMDTHAEPVNDRSLDPLFDKKAERVDSGFNLWVRTRGNCRILPDRLGNVVSLIYGQPSLQMGVVSDSDWRRKPVKSVSVADHYQKSGYSTVYWGPWGMGEEVPYDPKSRGFQYPFLTSMADPPNLVDRLHARNGSMDEVKQKLMNLQKRNAPLFCMIRQGGEVNKKSLLGLMKEVAANRNRPTVVFVLRALDAVAISKEHEADPVYYRNAEWQCAVWGGVEGYGKALKTLEGGSDVWQIQHALLILLGEQLETVPTNRIYHQGGWPLSDSPEKHRHRGSLVLGDKLALTDGLHLYALNEKGELNRKQPLELSEYPEAHQRLLMEHAQWWMSASRAINNPRAVDVGGDKQGGCRLTALDWRPSGIVHDDGSALASEPMVDQGKLLAILRGLRDNEKYRESFPAYSGSWSVNILRPGRYKITARLLAEKGLADRDKVLAQLKGGRAHIKLGGNEVQLRVMKGATSVSVSLDAEQGVKNLECWFTGQLSLDRELGAFFVEIERVGDKKFQLKAKSP